MPHECALGNALMRNWSFLTFLSDSVRAVELCAKRTTSDFWIAVATIAEHHRRALVWFFLPDYVHRQGRENIYKRRSVFLTIVGDL